MRNRIMLRLFPALLALSACHDEEWASNSSAPISDERLKELAQKPYNKGQMVGKRILLGTQSDVKIFADFPCGDICPDYTSRIIHLDVTPGPTCTAAGGVNEDEGVSVGTSNTVAPFCVPRAIARH